MGSPSPINGARHIFSGSVCKPNPHAQLASAFNHPKMQQGSLPAALLQSQESEYTRPA